MMINLQTKKKLEQIFNPMFNSKPTKNFVPSSFEVTPEAAEKLFGIQMKNSNENMEFALEKLEVSYAN